MGIYMSVHLTSGLVISKEEPLVGVVTLQMSSDGKTVPHIGFIQST